MSIMDQQRGTHDNRFFFLKACRDVGDCGLIQRYIHATAFFFCMLAGLPLSEYMDQQRGTHDNRFFFGKLAGLLVSVD